MTADQYRAARKQLELKQSELAKRLGVTTNTVSRRELGIVPISREADIAIKCLVINGGVSDLKSRKNVIANRLSETRNQETESK